MGRRSKRTDLTADEAAASDAITGVLEEVRADREAGTEATPAIAAPETDASTGQHGCDPEGALKTLWRIPELAAVTWHHSPSTRARIDGSLTIPSDPGLRPMSPAEARHELERFGAWLNGGAPTVRTEAEGKRTRVIVDGVLHGVHITLSALMPPPDPLTSVAPSTTEWAAVPEATPIASVRDSHPYIGPQYAVPGRAVPAASNTEGDAA